MQVQVLVQAPASLQSSSIRTLAFQAHCLEEEQAFRPALSSVAWHQTSVLQEVEQARPRAVVEQRRQMVVEEVLRMSHLLAEEEQLLRHLQVAQEAFLPLVVQEEAQVLRPSLSCAA